MFMIRKFHPRLKEILRNEEKKIVQLGNEKQMKEVVKQLKGASKMHAQQAAKIEKMIKSMKPKKKK